MTQKTYERAVNIRDEAWVAYDKTRGAIAEACEALTKANEIADKAWDAYSKAELALEEGGIMTQEAREQDILKIIDKARERYPLTPKLKILSDEEIDKAMKYAIDQAQHYTIRNGKTIPIPERQVAQAQLSKDIEVINNTK